METALQTLPMTPSPRLLHKPPPLLLLLLLWPVPLLLRLLLSEVMLPPAGALLGEGQLEQPT
jgi:hypothetical protein